MILSLANKFKNNIMNTIIIYIYFIHVIYTNKNYQLLTFSVEISYTTVFSGFLR